ncbi:MAG: SOS response-associated peptidase family protein [Bizionia sp.]|nr:SOS response-associated peptidase family protein [Bizionia sp.]
MNYKLSIDASRDTIENTFKRRFRFPNAYRTYKTIDGTKETTLPIITSEKQQDILLGIWGLLPDKYENDWKTFQKSLNTLFVNVIDLDTQSLFKDSYSKRRCLILVTGVYVTYLQEGELQTVLIQDKDRKPFSLAGVYNVTNDGFITCAIINTKEKESLVTNLPLPLKMPLIIKEEQRSIWLDATSVIENIKAITNQKNEFSHYTLKAS